MTVLKIPSVSEYLNTSANSPSILHSLHSLPVAVLAIPSDSASRKKHAKSAKHSRLLSNLLFLTCTHLHQHKCAKMCLKAFGQRNSMTCSKKSIFDFLLIPRPFLYLTFYTHDKLICYALIMITGVIETFAICHLYRLLWPWYSL